MLHMMTRKVDKSASRLDRAANELARLVATAEARKREEDLRQRH